MRIKKLTPHIIGLIIFFTSCSSSDIAETQHPVWEKFSARIEKGDVNFLLDNSFDSILCTDCIEGEDYDYYQSESIFKNHKDRLYDKVLLNNIPYSAYQNDSIIRITYIIQEASLFGNEGYSLAYMFDKENESYKFRGKISIP